MADAYGQYPTEIRERLFELRELILETAGETEGVVGFSEAVRWGEPSFITKSGSTVRAAQAGDNTYGLYFNCQSRLVETFRTLFPTALRFEGNRALVFDIESDLPVDEVRLCVSLALTYHKRKHLELLGA